MLERLFFAAILIILLVLYNRFEAKNKQYEENNNYNAIKEYLLDVDSLAKSRKPILWIHVPYEYNSRKWVSFGSRSSYDLNQPYLYLTIKSIINKCDDSFTICIIDDNSFHNLIPEWRVDMNSISNPILKNMRVLGMLKLLDVYGGMTCPISFLCMRDLIEMYSKGTEGDKMFVCETTNRSITSTLSNYYPSLSFCGVKKENKITKQLITHVQETMSVDFTSESEFQGNFEQWISSKLNRGINLISGTEIGVKTSDETPIIVDDLMSNNFLSLSKTTFGIFIPADEVLKRNKFMWFARASEKQVLESNTIIGNHILTCIGKSKGKELTYVMPEHR